MANVIPHPFEGSDVYCAHCQLPEDNATHHGRTDHSRDIELLRLRANVLTTDIEQLIDAHGDSTEPMTDTEKAMLRDNARSGALAYELAADLLELHDDTGISLDNWESARMFVETRIGHEITENGA